MAFDLAAVEAIVLAIGEETISALGGSLLTKSATRAEALALLTAP